MRGTGGIGMDARDLKEIEEFLSGVGKGSLFEYYSVSEECPDEELERVIKKRRSWAQGQQSNPKFRREAIWLIKQSALVRRVLTEQRAAYLASVQERGSEQARSALTLFIQGTLAGGPLTSDGRRAILQHGTSLGLHTDEVMALIERQSDPSDTAGPALNFYALLEVAPGADISEIEAVLPRKQREPAEGGKF